eukprot:m51a1_g3141 hypothetical protein (330) ;mRNA; r:307551-308621
MHHRSSATQLTSDEAVLASEVPSRSERAFAALSGPVLGLNARVLHQNRRFVAELLLTTRWRTSRGLEPADVSAALLRARVCRASTLQPIETCARCGGIVVLAHATARDAAAEPAGATPPAAALPPGVESFVAGVRTVCTSSGRHLQANLVVLEAELAPGVVVRSSQFAIYARAAGRQSKRGRTDAAPAAAEPSTSPRMAGSPEGPSRTPEGPSQGQQAVVPSPLATTVLSSGLSLVVGVKTLTVSAETWMHWLKMCAEVTRQHVPGFLLQKTTVSDGVCICVSGYRSQQEAHEGTVVQRHFARNRIPNPLNRDMIGDGTIIHLALVNSW